MKTKGEKVAELIDALDNGNILYKEYDLGEREFLFKAGDSYEGKGWSSALGTVRDRMLWIIENPDTWKIFPDFNMNTDAYPYPWSTKWKREEIKPKGLDLTIVLLEDEKGEGYTGYFKELPNVIAERATKEGIIERLSDSLHDIFLTALDEYNKS